MPTKRQQRKLVQESNRIPAGNEMKPGSKREHKPSQWTGVSSPPSIWERTDLFRKTLGMAWGIRKSK